MSGSDKGRGRGRGARKVKIPNEPDKESLDKINQEKASLVPKAPGQMDDADEVSDAAKTTIGDGEKPLLTEDLKKAVQRGVQVGHPAIKLNPSATDFIPKFDTLSLSITTQTTSTTTSHPVYSKYSTPTNPDSSTSTLNPTSEEFVPSRNLVLPKDAKEFVPSLFGSAELSRIPNGDTQDYGNGVEFDDEDIDGYLNVNDIMRGYEKAAPTDLQDSSNRRVLEDAANMLLRVLYYPGSFEKMATDFKSTLITLNPSESTLMNLAEMLVHWGVNSPDLRYGACRIAKVTSETDGEFKTILFRRLQSWHVKCYDKNQLTEDEKVLLANYSGFFAELFSKVEVPNSKFLQQYILKYVKALLGLKEDHFIREACRIMKLTGSSLHDEAEMVAVMKMMKDLAIDKTLSSTCTALIMQVLELSGSKWSASASPAQPIADTVKPSGLNTNAMPFVPSDPSLFNDKFADEIFYDPPILQQPVSCAADWDEFVGDDQPVEGYENSAIGAVVDEDDYDGLDPDIELEMEAFIEEIEEHLMLQDFDPELTKPDGH